MQNVLNESEPITLQADGYSTLATVLQRAFNQAARGKGKERHATQVPFTQQPMLQLVRMYGAGFALGQVAKKAHESQRLPRDRAVAELLGAINYLAGAVIVLEEQQPAADTAANDNCPGTCGRCNGGGKTACGCVLGG